MSKSTPPHKIFTIESDVGEDSGPSGQNRDEGGTIAVALLADFSVNGDSWLLGAVRAHS